MKSWQKLLIALGLILGLAVVAGRVFLGPVVDSGINRTESHGPYEISDAARGLHDRLTIVDLHADPLLWQRDLRQRHTYGHTDLPRLREGNVALQVFGMVTKVPLGQNYESNPTDAADQLVPLTMVNGWPLATWFSPYQRALHIAEKLHDLTIDSDGAIRIIRTKDDIDALLADRFAGEEVIGGLLGLEGLQAMEAEPEKLHRLFDVGVRMGGLAHFFDNRVAGSTHGEDKYGLTDLGRQVIPLMEDMGMVIDLAHSSPKVIDEVLAMATKPLVVSHGGVKGTCAGDRNLSDDHVRGIARLGGVIGVGVWEGAVCGTSPAHTVRAMVYIRDLVGIDHVGLGTDYDGAVAAAYDVTGLAFLTQELQKNGFSDQDIAAIMGGNSLRVLRDALPD